MTNPALVSMFGMGPAANAASDDPEAFQLLQNERNKQLLANLLLNRGLQQPQGQMVGRFYVPPSPVQHLGGLASAGLGAYMMGQQGQGMAGLAEKRKAARAQAIQEYVRKTQPTTIPAQTLPEGVEGPVSPEQTVPPDPSAARQAVLDAMTNQDPIVRESVKFLEQQKAAQDEKSTQREFLAQENAMNRAARLEESKARIDQMLVMKLITDEQAAKMKADMEKTLHAMDIQGRKEVAAITAQGKQDAQAAKPPAGYRFTKDGNLEAIPGGPADTKLQGAFNQDTAQLQSSSSNFDRLAATANSILNHPGLAGITGIRGKVPDIPGTDAANARALLNALKSQVAFDVLQDMRNNSKTGGALGNVSDAEGKRLENNLAALDTTQGIDQFKKQLSQIIDFANAAKGRLQDAYNLKHKGVQAPAAVGSTGGLTPAEQQELDQLRKRFGK